MSLEKCLRDFGSLIAEKNKKKRGRTGNQYAPFCAAIEVSLSYIGGSAVKPEIHYLWSASFLYRLMSCG
jgi:hypothetical protein